MVWLLPTGSHALPSQLSGCLFLWQENRSLPFGYSPLTSQVRNAWTWMEEPLPSHRLLLPCSWYSKKRTGATADSKRARGRNSPARPVTAAACARDRTASWAQPQAMNGVVFKISPWAQCARLGWEVQVDLIQPFFFQCRNPPKHS